MIRTQLLSTTALGLVVALGMGSAQAEEAGFYGAIEGGYIFSEIDGVHGSYRSAPGGYTYRTDAETVNGWGGRIEGGLRYGAWTFGVAGLYQETDGSDSSLSPGSFAYEFDNEASYLAIDFEVGREFGLGTEGGTVRPFVGLRYAEIDFTQDGTFADLDGSNPGSYDLDSKTWGIGPKLGADVHVPLGGSNFSLDGAAAGFVLFGKQERDDSASFASGFSGSYSDKNGETLFGAEASLGLTWNFEVGGTSAGGLTLGYRVDWIDDAVEGEQQLYDVERGSQRDYLTHGPFLRFNIKG